MSPQVVTRRFEIHAPEGALDAVANVVAGAAPGFGPEQLKRDIVRHRRSPMVSARLTGEASAVDAVRRSVPNDPTLRVLNDWLDAPGADHLYPDRRALLRIDPSGHSRRVVGSGARVLVAIVDSGITVITRISPIACGTPMLAAGRCMGCDA